MENTRVKVTAGRKDAGTFNQKSPAQIQAEKSERQLPRRPSSASDLLADSDLFYRNQPLPKGVEMFPLEWKMRFCDMYYPYAKRDGKNAPLFMDFPNTDWDVAMCKRKKETLMKHGIRYTYFEPGRGEWDARQIMDCHSKDQFEHLLKARELAKPKTKVYAEANK